MKYGCIVFRVFLLCAQLSKLVFILWFLCCSEITDFFKKVKSGYRMGPITITP